MAKIKLTVNGKRYTRDVEDRTLLANLIRDDLGLTGTHIGCDTTQCGACTVHMNGRAVKSCTVLKRPAPPEKYLVGPVPRSGSCSVNTPSPAP